MTGGLPGRPWPGSPDTEDGFRRQFEEGLGFRLDDFQRRPMDAIDRGESVLVSAPTGSGKTLVAEYAAARALAAGAKAFYTTPIKALSNQKFAELVARYGAERVGLLTGDVSHQATRPHGGHDHRGSPQHALRPVVRSSTGWPSSSSTRSTTSRTPTGGRCGRRCWSSPRRAWSS